MSALLEQCEPCGGSGRIPGGGWRKDACPKCDGTGYGPLRPGGPGIRDTPKGRIMRELVLAPELASIRKRLSLRDLAVLAEHLSRATQEGER